MTVKKEAVAGVEAYGKTALAAAGELEEINRFTKTPLTRDQVYLFSVRLCDNQVDRDGEYFSRDGLEQLAPLFVGKSGIFDHDWSAKNQAARIYRTEVLSEPGVVEETGEVACFLKGYAYMLRSEANEPLIAEIEAGIKKEVSVSCSVSRSSCSICGNDVKDRHLCSHVKGQSYDGKPCVVKLEDPVDAFEWSFVAVPAQRNAGVIKAAKEGGMLSGASEKGRQARLEKEAAWGRRYLEDLRAEVVRLGLLAQDGMEAQVLGSIASKLEEGELLQMKGAFEQSAARKLPLQTQLNYGKTEAANMEADTVFCI